MTYFCIINRIYKVEEGKYISENQGKSKIRNSTLQHRIIVTLTCIFSFNIHLKSFIIKFTQHIFTEYLLCAR